MLHVAAVQVSSVSTPHSPRQICRQRFRCMVWRTLLLI